MMVMVEDLPVTEQQDGGSSMVPQPNTDEITEFIQSLLNTYSAMGVEGFIEFRAFPEAGDKGRDAWSSSIAIQPETLNNLNAPLIARDLCRLSKEKYGVFVGYNPRNTSAPGKKINIVRPVAVYTDLDCYKAGRTPLATAVYLQQFKPCYLVGSGRGVQAVWIVDNIRDTAEWIEIQKGLKAKFIEYGADQAVVTDTARVLRVPGTINWKNDDPNPAWLIEKGIRTYGARELLEAFPVPEELMAPVGDEGGKRIPDELKEGGDAQWEGRNGFLFKYGCRLRNDGVDDSLMLDMLTAINQRICDPPLDDFELNMIHTRVCTYEKGTTIQNLVEVEACRDKLGYTYGEMSVTEFPTVQEVIYGLNSGDLGLLQARPNVGKTTLLRNLAICLAAGMPFAPLLPKEGVPRKVVFVDSEDNAGFAKADIARMVAPLAPDKQRLVEDNLLLIVDAEIKGFPLDLSNKLHMAAVTARCEEFQPDLVIIDTVSASFSLKNENDNSEVTEKVLLPCRDLARKVNTALLLVHHIGKKREDEDQMYAGRGASAYQAMPRLVLNLLPVIGADGAIDKGKAELICTKIKTRRAFPNVRLTQNFETRWLTTGELTNSTDTQLIAADADDNARAMLSTCLLKRAGSMSVNDFVAWCQSDNLDMTKERANLIFARALRDEVLVDLGNWYYGEGIALRQWRKDQVEVDEGKCFAGTAGGT